MKQVQDVIERLWDFIDKLDINTFGEFTEPREALSMSKKLSMEVCCLKRVPLCCLLQGSSWLITLWALWWFFPLFSGFL